MKLWEFDLQLYGLLKKCLRGDYVSPLRDALTPDMRAGMLQMLRTVEVGERCGCGSADCRSFSTRPTPSGDDRRFAVRFHVHGELHVTCDARGVIYHVKYLPDPAPSREATCHALTGDGWSPRPVAG